MNCFLKSRNEINLATAWLKAEGYISHPISCKDFELKLIVDKLSDGPLLDMGANGSFVLHNAIIKNIQGRKVGVDLAEVTGDNKAEGAEYYQADLMATGFPGSTFMTITCQSVIEHQVDYAKFAKECSRLLKPGGILYVSFDFWPIKPDTSKTRLYDLEWNILDQKDVLSLVLEMDRNGMSITGEIDWSIGDAVINDKFCSPVRGVSYTFGILSFVKN